MDEALALGRNSCCRKGFYVQNTVVQNLVILQIWPISIFPVDIESFRCPRIAPWSTTVQSMVKGVEAALDQSATVEFLNEQVLGHRILN